MSRMIALFSLLCELLTMSACAESIHQVQRTAESLGIPLELESEIDRTVHFADLQQAPGEYVGRTVMLGGTVIKGKRTKDGTELEVLQRPTGEEGRLTEDRLRSEGRFLAIREFLDPASLPEGTPITVIGTVKGVTTRQLDETDYVYPVLEVKHIIDWKSLAAQRPRNPGLYYGSYYPPYGYGWGGFNPYGAYPYSYWGGPGLYRPYYFGPRSFSPGLSPPPPPPPRVPPDLRRKR